MQASISPRRQGELHPWRQRLAKLLLILVLLAFTFVVMIPFLWIILLSAKTTQEILMDPYRLPQTIQWRNYVNLFTDPRIRFYRYFFNSVFVAVFALLLGTFLATLGGYGFGRPRLSFRFRGALFTFVLFALMLPPQILYIPQFVMMAKYDLINTRWSLVLLYAATQLPVSIFLMSTYFSQLPAELEDAARIDGCSDLRTFWQVMLPLARPALATVLILNFMSFWNELLLSITMVTSPDMRTLPAAIYFFVSDNAGDFAMAATSLVVAMLPVLVLYVLMAERFIEGLTAGAVKG